MQTRSFASLLVAATLSCVVGCSVDKNGLTLDINGRGGSGNAGASASVGGSGGATGGLGGNGAGGTPEPAGPPEPAATTTKAPADGARTEWARAEPALGPAPAEARLVEKAPADRARGGHVIDASVDVHDGSVIDTGVDLPVDRAVDVGPDVPVCDTTHGMHRCGDTCVSNSSPDSCGTTSCAACPVPANATATCDGA